MAQVEELKATNRNNDWILLGPPEDARIGDGDLTHHPCSIRAGYAHYPTDASNVLCFQPSEKRRVRPCCAQCVKQFRLDTCFINTEFKGQRETPVPPNY
eukprot:12563568-Alexandrium_andersonii.AAC.1